MKPALLVLSVSAAALAGCASGAQTSPSTIRTNVARQVLHVMDAQGMPVESDSVGCDGPDVSGVVSCAATTATTPTGNITATFTVRRHNRRCPGQLTVHMSGTLVATLPTDPCT
ncbi:MAG: hypothetical protein J2P57_02115 [Acidimicrobiaceae bacterium]|nr:hypothetical protein [Acidimicrobiaceae bacterium]